MRTVLAQLEPVVPAGRLSRLGEPIHRRAVTLAPALGGRVVWAGDVGSGGARTGTDSRSAYGSRGAAVPSALAATLPG